MKLAWVESHVLLAPNYDPRFTSSAQDSFVVIVRTEDGFEGIGESDVNPWIAKACLEAPGTHTMGLCMKELLLGADPLDIEGIWRRIYLGTAMNGRRGAVVHTLGAVEMALWDLKGKALGKPVHELLGGAVRPTVVPYASLQPAGHSFEEYRDALVESAVKAKGLGFKAVKSEVTMNGPYAHSGLHESYDRHTEVVAAVRKALGPDVTLMIDVQYLWEDAPQPHCAFIEYLPPALCLETLRKELAAEDLQLVDGEIPLPTRPGLGFQLNRDALKRFTVA